MVRHVLLRVFTIVGTFLCQGLEISVGIVVAVGVVESLQDCMFMEVHWLNVFLVIIMVVKFGVGLVLSMILAINMLGLFMVNNGLLDVSFSMSILMEEFVVRRSAMIINLTFFHCVEGCLMWTSSFKVLINGSLFVEVCIFQVNNRDLLFVVGLLFAMQV